MSRPPRSGLDEDVSREDTKRAVLAATWCDIFVSSCELIRGYAA